MTCYLSFIVKRFVLQGHRGKHLKETSLKHKNEDDSSQTFHQKRSVRWRTTLPSYVVVHEQR